MQTLLLMLLLLLRLFSPRLAPLLKDQRVIGRDRAFKRLAGVLRPRAAHMLQPSLHSIWVNGPLSRWGARLEFVSTIRWTPRCIATSSGGGVVGGRQATEQQARSRDIPADLARCSRTPPAREGLLPRAGRHRYRIPRLPSFRSLATRLL